MVIVTDPGTAMPTGPWPGETRAWTREESCLRAQRAAWISSLSTSTVPRPRGSAATCDAQSRLRGPSAEISEPLRIAPAKTTSDSTVRSQKNAVSSIVSVPWVTTTPPPDARRATSSIVSGVTFQPLTWAIALDLDRPQPRHASPPGPRR